MNSIYGELNPTVRELKNMRGSLSLDMLWYRRLRWNIKMFTYPINQLTPDKPEGSGYNK